MTANSDDMSDFSEYKAYLKARSKTKRQRNLKNAIAALQYFKIPHQVHNNGLHFVIHSENLRIDYWPTTGYWKTEASSGRGLKEVLKLLSIETPKSFWKDLNSSEAALEKDD